jgi:predicted dehydrogenase
MRKLRMGIIGTGMAFERLHYPAYQKLTDRFVITAICDLDTQKAKNWQNTLGLGDHDVYSDFRKMIARGDIDAIDIMVPIESNFEVTEEVAKAGKPIICEKPLAPTKEQAKAAKELPRQYDVPVMIAENYRYNDEVNIIRNLVRNQEIGTVRYFLQNRVVNTPQEMLKNAFAAKEWRQHPEFAGGVFYDTAVHDIAALQHIFGAVERVHAFGVKQEEDFAPFAVIQANLSFRSSITGQFTFFCAGSEMQRPLVGLRILGTDGMIFLEERDCGTVNVAYNDGTSKQISYQPRMGFYHELLNFYKAATGQEPISVTPELEYGDAMVIFAMLDSVEQQEVIEMAEYAQYDPVLV